MDILRRCGNCGYYPACSKTTGASGYCDDHKYEGHLKLESKKRELFAYKKIYRS